MKTGIGRRIHGETFGSFGQCPQPQKRRIQYRTGKVHLRSTGGILNGLQYRPGIVRIFQGTYHHFCFAPANSVHQGFQFLRSGILHPVNDFELHLVGIKGHPFVEGISILVVGRNHRYLFDSHHFQFGKNQLRQRDVRCRHGPHERFLDGNTGCSARVTSHNIFRRRHHEHRYILVVQFVGHYLHMSVLQRADNCLDILSLG